jgi:hypothetical protein
MVSFRRLLYCDHLKKIAEGQGGTQNRAMRRITSRSRFRAAQAYHILIHSHALHRNLQQLDLNDTVENLYLSATDVQSWTRLRRYLYCLSELHDSRILCSEENLALALGVIDVIAPESATNMTHQKTIHGYSDPRQLIMTWLHDESDNIDAIELARDVLLCSSSPRHHVIEIWRQFIQHMIDYRHYRPLIQTIIILSRPHNFNCNNILQALLYSNNDSMISISHMSSSHSISSQLKSIIQDFFYAIVEKSEQVKMVVIIM